MKRVTTGHNGSQQKSSGIFQSFCGLSMSVSAPHIIANTFWHIRIEHSADLGIKMIKDAFCLFIDRSFDKMERCPHSASGTVQVYSPGEGVLLILMESTNAL